MRSAPPSPSPVSHLSACCSSSPPLRHLRRHGARGDARPCVSECGHVADRVRRGRDAAELAHVLGGVRGGAGSVGGGGDVFGVVAAVVSREDGARVVAAAAVLPRGGGRPGALHARGEWGDDESN